MRTGNIMIGAVKKNNPNAEYILNWNPSVPLKSTIQKWNLPNYESWLSKTNSNISLAKRTDDTYRIKQYEQAKAAVEAYLKKTGKLKKYRDSDFIPGHNEYTPNKKTIDSWSRIKYDNWIKKIQEEIKKASETGTMSETFRTVAARKAVKNYWLSKKK